MRDIGSGIPPAPPALDILLIDDDTSEFTASIIDGLDLQDSTTQAAPVGPLPTISLAFTLM
jgi:hypothetical protein